MSVSFRQVDIDRLDPDSPVNFHPEVIESGVTVQDVHGVAQEVKSALGSGNGAKALKLAVQNPPYGSDEAAKDAALDTILQVLSSMRISEIDAAVKGLDTTEQTVLVKYLYKASSSPKGKANGSILLNWMDRTFAIAGQGALSKYLTDRRTV